MTSATSHERHRLSPSSFGRAFEVACERHFKLSLLTTEHTPEPWLSLKQEGQRLLKERLTTVQILEGGHAWEEEALSRPEVAPHLIAPPGEGPLTSRRWGEGDEELEQSLRALREAPVGALIYQPKLRPPATLYDRLGLRPAQVTLRDNLPDLIQVMSPAQLEREALGQLPFSEWLKLALDYETPASERVFRVIDLKRSAKVKPSHRAQVFYYATELDELISLGQLKGRVDLEWGGVWLGGAAEPERVSLTAVAPYILGTIAELPKLLAGEVSEANWSLNGRCEHCDYWRACSAQAKEEDHLSRLSGLSQGGAEAIRSLGVSSVNELPALLNTPAHEATLNQVASLDGRLPILKARAEAHREGRAIELKRLSQLLPQAEDIAVFLTVQQEPVGAQMWGFGLLVRDDKGYLELPTEPYIELAGSRSDSFNTASRWLNALDTIWERVEHLNRRQGQKLTLQVYCYSDLERRLVQRCLSEMRAHESFQAAPPHQWSSDQRALMGRIERALYVIQGAEMLGERSHPKDVRELPVIPLLSALVGRYALPIDVVYTLPEVSELLELSLVYPRDEARHDPYNHQLRPDGIIELWETHQRDTSQLDEQERERHERLLEERIEQVKRIEEDLNLRLRVYAELLTRLRTPSPFAQVRSLSPFSLPSAEPLSHPDLSRLSYLARQERIQAQRGVKQVRYEGAASAIQHGTLTRLRALGDARFEVLTIGREQSLEVNGFADLILVEASEDGLRRAAMIADDVRQPSPGVDRAAYVKVMKRLHCAEAGAEGSSRVAVGDEIALCEARNQEYRFGDELPVGLELFLCERFSNVTDHKIHKALSFHSKQYQRGGSLFVSLLEDVSSIPNELHYPESIAEPLKSAPNLSQLTDSQRAAWGALTQQRLSAIWGPPGTGKTHFLASYVLGLIYAHERAGLRVNVVLSAMTNAGIDNLVDKVAELAWAEYKRWGAPLPMIIRGKRAQRAPTHGVHYVSGKKAIASEVSRAEGEGSLILGVTQWALADLELAVDLLVIDEASQLLVLQASVGFSKLTEDGRVIVAGDHKQLGPVLRGDWGRDELERRLTGSIFDLVRGAEERTGVTPHQLLENFRMNRSLTALSQAIYGPRYLCANDEVASRSCSFDVRAALPSASTVARLLGTLGISEPPALFNDPLPFLEATLGEGSVSLVILDGPSASRENPLESALVGLCVEAMRLGTDRATPDSRFWAEELFVIGPHNRQNDLTRDALSVMRAWGAAPFVQTVDKAQGQEARCVLISYGVSDLEFILAEQDFIYDLNRLNVSITRAQAKLILFLSRPLLDGEMSILNSERALAGLSYMQRVESTCRSLGSAVTLDLGGAHSVEVLTLA